MTKQDQKGTKLPYIKLNEGLAIRKVSQSKNWGLYLKLKGQKPLQFSLKTPDEAEARTKAMKEYVYALALLENGESIRQPKQRLTLHQVIDELLDEYLQLQQAAVVRSTKKVVKGKQRYATEIRYWKRIKSFYGSKLLPKQLDVGEVRQYFLNQGTAMSKNTAGKIRFCFRKIFERSLEKKLITNEHIFDLNQIQYEKKPVERRDAFTEDEFNALIMYAMLKHKTSGKGIHTNKMCIAYVSFMYFCGMRPGDEAMEIKWSDLGVNKHGDLYCVVNGGKTAAYSKNKRNVVLDILAHASLLLVAKIKHNDMIQNLDDYQTIETLARTKPDEFIFSSNYSRMPKYDKTFNAWMEYLNTENIIPKSKNLTLYSLRHSYITRGIENNIPLSLLAENAGTSVKMIEEHYSHITTMSEASRKYLVSYKLLTQEQEKKEPLTPEQIQIQKNELLDLVAKEFPI